MKFRSGTGPDAAWKHGTKVDHKVRCNYCSKVVSNVTRLKLHLAKVGGNVKSCPSVPETVRREFLKCLEDHPYRSVVKLEKNFNTGESSLAGVQSSHQQASRDNQTKDGGSHHNVGLQRQSIVDMNSENCTAIGVSDDDLLNEAETAQKNVHLSMDKAFKAFNEFKHKMRGEREQYRKIQETTNEQLREKVEEVEAQNNELEILGAALEAKRRELTIKEDEMERLRTEAIAAKAEGYMKGRDEMIVKAKELGFNQKLLLTSPYDPTEH